LQDIVSPQQISERKTEWSALTDCAHQNERSLAMSDKYHTLRSVLIEALLLVSLGARTRSASLGLTEQTLETIQKCMAQSPAPWPEQWEREYIGTIRRAIEHHQDVPHYAERLEILRKGFARCWETVPKTKGKNDRSLFEVYRCRMRWYVEHLMGTKFPTKQEKLKLRDQFTGIWDHAADSLLAEFGFLDPNAIQKAEAEDLSACYRKIETPLMPVSAGFSCSLYKL
jgi:hypothetical protein